MPQTGQHCRYKMKRNIYDVLHVALNANFAHKYKQ